MVQGGMKKSPKPGRGKLAVLGGLGMVLAALVFRMIKPSPDSAPAAPLPPAIVATAAPATPPPPPAGKPNRINWPAAATRNPFQSAAVYPPQVVRVEPAKVTPAAPPPPPPVDWAAAARSSIHLKGTVQQGGRSLAMVNGRLYRAGESVAGFRIVEIGKRSMTVEQGGTKVVVEAE